MVPGPGPKSVKYTVLAWPGAKRDPYKKRKYGLQLLLTYNTYTFHMFHCHAGDYARRICARRLENTKR